MTTAAILVPRRPDGGQRDILWALTRPHWESTGYPIIEGDDPDTGRPFNRSAALNRAAALAPADADIFLIVDSDVIMDIEKVEAAIESARASGRFTMPFSVWNGLGKPMTDRILAGFKGSWARGVTVRYADSVSACVVVPRALFEQVGGFDERFEGWGLEDSAFHLACSTMAGGWDRLDGDLWHMWHPTPQKERADQCAANRRWFAPYREADGDQVAMAAVIENRSVVPVAPKFRRPPRVSIPKVLHRTVPAVTTDEVEGWWAGFAELHPGWDLVTWRDPLDPAEFPITSPLWDRCSVGAQLAGLVRLEAIWWHGGIYVDSDVECYRRFDPLLALSCFAGWQDADVVPDAVFGAEAGHPAVKEMLEAACTSVELGGNPHQSGPDVFTSVLPGRDDVTLFPPGTFYPYHYSPAAKRAGRGRDHAAEQPWAFCAHHWHGGDPGGWAHQKGAA